jgi:hypothetical protein
MSRGMLNGMAVNPLYADAEKHWHVTFQQSFFYWYDLIVNPPDFVDTKGGVSKLLKELKAKVEQNFDKHFVYFFVSRPKVRFDLTRPPKFGFFSKNLKIAVLVGRERKRYTLKIPFPERERKSLPHPRIELSEQFITIHWTETYTETMTIHDFLIRVGFNIGAPSTIQYIGVTKNPADRTLNREHRGIADTLYNVSNEENDFFICVSLFKVQSFAKNNAYRMQFVVPNVMTDEIGKEKEGKIVEGALMTYFKCRSQDINAKAHWTSFANSLKTISQQNKIYNVSVHLELDLESEYFTFGSNRRPYAQTHTFCFSLGDNEPTLTTYDSEEDLLRVLSES